MRLLAPALATNVFVLLAGPREAAGRAYLSTLWHRIGTALGLDLPVERLGVPRDLPSDAGLGSLGAGLVAGRERRDAGVWQACVRVEYDVACVSLLMAPGRQRSGWDCGGAWADLQNQLDIIGTGTRSPVVLGESRVFCALSTGRSGRLTELCSSHAAARADWLVAGERRDIARRRLRGKGLGAERGNRRPAAAPADSGGAGGRTDRGRTPDLGGWPGRTCPTDPAPATRSEAPLPDSRLRTGARLWPNLREARHAGGGAARGRERG